MVLLTIIIAACAQLGGIGVGCSLSSHRSRSNGWRDEGPEGFEPDFTYRNGSSYRRKLRFVTTKTKTAGPWTAAEVAPAEEEAEAPRGKGLVPQAVDAVRGLFFPGSKPCKVLILFSDTGGGHRASALAMEAAFDLAYPGRFQCELLDLWRHHSVPPLNTLVETYQFAAKNPWVWELMYVNADFPMTRWIFQELGNATSFKKFRAVFEEKAPDLIISVHPLCQNLPLRVLKAMGGGKRAVPFVTVCTDLGGAHPTWFSPEADRVYIPSAPIRRMAFREGVPVPKLRELGLPIRPAFWNSGEDQKKVQGKLAVQRGVPSVLIVGGGDGVGGLKNVALATINELGRAGAPRQAIVVCGSNAALQEELGPMNFPTSVNVIVNGYVKNMDEWMAACDVLITKAGPGTIAEAAIRGLPVMLSNYLPGQEEGNLDFVRDHGFGEYSPDPATIAATVEGWLRDPERLRAMRERALAAGRPKATNDIIHDVADFIGVR
mmetsp:Transcript_4635/g.7701  ORF Transcript_4635/g.7701 Transcript_4635/m.7701 type:complete len:490 (+) Transcript_4635:53-1522(+)